MLNKHIKNFIRSSINETGIIELKLMIEFYGFKDIDKALKIIDRIRLYQGLILKKMYANCTKVYSNYYEWDEKKLHDLGYDRENRFFVKRDFSIIK